MARASRAVSVSDIKKIKEVQKLKMHTQGGLFSALGVVGTAMAAR